MVNHVLCKAQSSKQMQLYITRGISLKIILGQNSNCDLKIKVTMYVIWGTRWSCLGLLGGPVGTESVYNQET